MKKYLFISLLLISLSFKINTETSFKVYGNCEMCKQRIEKAAKKLKGVKSATWSMNTHLIKVIYTSEITSIERLHQAIADVGYDTDKIKSTDAKYKALPRCCQYKRAE